MNNANITAAAAQVVSFAEFHGGRARVEEIATIGFKGDLNMTQLGLTLATADDRFEMLNAIQDHAKSVSAAY